MQGDMLMWYVVYLTLGAHARSEGYCSCPVCLCVCVCVCVCLFVVFCHHAHLDPEI